LHKKACFFVEPIGQMVFWAFESIQSDCRCSLIRSALADI